MITNPQHTPPTEEELERAFQYFASAKERNEVYMLCGVDLCDLITEVRAGREKIGRLEKEAACLHSKITQSGTWWTCCDCGHHSCKRRPALFRWQAWSNSYAPHP